jgi:hypothetical protein
MRQVNLQEDANVTSDAEEVMMKLPKVVGHKILKRDEVI